MLKSYVAIATRSGLDSLVPEHNNATPALLARAARANSVCCWAVLPDTEAAEIGYRIAAGEAESALALLESAARSVGRVLPDDLSS